jgi:hypothetical protein
MALECVYKCWPTALSKLWSVLAMDAFHGHLSRRIKNKIGNKNIDLAITYSGKTSWSQPLDIWVNKPFKLLVHIDS